MALIGPALLSARAGIMRADTGRANVVFESAKKHRHVLRAAGITTTWDKRVPPPTTWVRIL